MTKRVKHIPYRFPGAAKVALLTALPVGLLSFLYYRNLSPAAVPPPPLKPKSPTAVPPLKPKSPTVLPPPPLPPLPLLPPSGPPPIPLLPPSGPPLRHSPPPIPPPPPPAIVNLVAPTIAAALLPKSPASPSTDVLEVLPIPNRRSLGHRGAQVAMNLEREKEKRVMKDAMKDVISTFRPETEFMTKAQKEEYYRDKILDALLAFQQSYPKADFRMITELDRLDLANQLLGERLGTSPIHPLSSVIAERTADAQDILDEEGFTYNIEFVEHKSAYDEYREEYGKNALVEFLDGYDPKKLPQILQQKADDKADPAKYSTAPEVLIIYFPKKYEDIYDETTSNLIDYITRGYGKIHPGYELAAFIPERYENGFDSPSSSESSSPSFSPESNPNLSPSILEPEEEEEEEDDDDDEAAEAAAKKAAAAIAKPKPKLKQWKPMKRSVKRVASLGRTSKKRRSLQQYGSETRIGSRLRPDTRDEINLANFERFLKNKS